MIAIFVLIALIGVAAWSIRADSFNRFVLSCTFTVLFLPYELFSSFGPVEALRKISPFAFYVTIFAILSVFRTDFFKYLRFHRSLIVYIVMFGYIVVLTYLNSGGKGWGTIIDNYLAVFLCCQFMVMNISRLGEIEYKKIIVMISISSIYMFLEFVANYNVFYTPIFSEAEWVESQWGMGYHRSTGGIGHPLIAASIYLIFLPFISNFKFKYTVLVYGLAFMAIVTTGSRSAFFLATAYTIYLIYKNNDVGRFSIYMGLAFLCTGFLFIFGFFDSIIYRTFNADGSTAVRLAVFDIVDEVIATGWFGNGIGTTAEFIERVSFYNAIEITWVSFIIEIGFLGLILFFLSWIFFFSLNKVLNSNSGMLILLFFMVTSYNSLVVHTPIMFILSIFVFLNHYLVLKSSKPKMVSGFLAR